MVTREQILQIVDFKGDSHSVVSLYLSPSLEKLKYGDFVAEAKSLLKKIEEDPLFKGEYRKIIDFLETRFEPSARSVVIFSSPKSDFFQVYEIPIPLKGTCIAGKEPYIKPLIRLLEQYERYCLVLVDGKKARIFSIYMGKLEEHTYILDEVPGWHKQGGWSQARFQRHIEQQIYEHLKKVADITLTFFKKEQFDRLILGGPPEVVAHFKNIIHIYLVRRFVGSIAIDVNASIQEIEKRAISLIEKIEEKENEELMQRVLDNMGKMAVAGIKDVTTMLNQGRIQVLLVDPDLSTEGWICPKCHFISTTSAKCNVCESDVKKSEDIIENIIEQNFELAGEIHFLNNNETLKDLGGIAAILRW